MQASLDLKKSPDRVTIAGFAMLATLVLGGVSGYAVKSLTTSASVISPAVTVATAGVASPASDSGIAKRALQLELKDEKTQAGVIAPAARASHAARRTQQ